MISSEGTAETFRRIMDIVPFRLCHLALGARRRPDSLQFRWLPSCPPGMGHMVVRGTAVPGAEDAFKQTRASVSRLTGVTISIVFLSKCKIRSIKSVACNESCMIGN